MKLSNTLTKNKYLIVLLFIFILSLNGCSTIPEYKSKSLNHNVEPKFLSFFFPELKWLKVKSGIQKLTISTCIWRESNEWEEPQKDYSYEFTTEGLLKKKIVFYSDKYGIDITNVIFEGKYPIKEIKKVENKSLFKSDSVTQYYYNQRGELVATELTEYKEDEKFHNSTRSFILCNWIVVQQHGVSTCYQLNANDDYIENFKVANTNIKTLAQLKKLNPICRKFFYYNNDGNLEKEEKICNGKLISLRTTKYNDKGFPKEFLEYKKMKGADSLQEYSKTLWFNYKHDEHGNWTERIIENQIKYRKWKTTSKFKKIRKLEYN